MAQYDLSDDSVVIVIGSGAGGGTLANELCQKGVNVVLLEAGKRYSIEDFVNDEWNSFLQLAWLDKRTTSGTWRVAKDFPNLPTWTCKTVGGTTDPLGRRLAALPGRTNSRSRTEYGDVAGANLLDWPLTYEEMEPYYTKAEDKMGVTRTHDIPGLPGNNNFKVMYNGAIRVGYKKVHTGRMAINSRPRDDRAVVPAARLLLPGLQVRRQVVDALHRDPEGRGDGKARPAAGIDGLADPARRRRQGHRRALCRQGRQPAGAESPGGLRRVQLDRDAAAAAELGLGEVPGRARELVGSGRPQLHASHHGLGLRDLRRAGAHVPRHDHGRDHHRRVRQRSGPGLRRRLRAGDPLARPAVHGGVPRARRLGSRLRLGDGELRPHGRACGSSGRTCRRKRTA